jgi:hypothetical protein
MLFNGIDDIGCEYIFFLTDDQNENLKYICTPISKKRLKEFRKGIVDLRTIFVEPEIKEFYQCEIQNFSDQTCFIDFFSSDDLPSSILPEQGFYLNEHDEIIDEIIKKAKELNKPILYASLEPPESQFETKIMADRLSHFLSAFQNMVKYAYKKTFKQVSTNIMSFKQEDAHKLQVFGFTEGSFTVMFEPLDAGDIFGSCFAIESSFEKIDEIVDVISDNEATLNILKKNKGHLVSAYIRLLKFISENNTTFEYKWATPIFNKSKKNRISQNDAKPLLDFLTSTEDISSETIIFTGYIIRADKKNNTWKILNDEDKKEYAGKVKDGVPLSLEGVVIGSVKYQFICEEKIEEVLGTGKEQKIIQLIEYNEISAQR